MGDFGRRLLKDFSHAVYDRLFRALRIWYPNCLPLLSRPQSRPKSKGCLPVLLQSVLILSGTVVALAAIVASMSPQQ